jgi:hypothetical protein
MNYFFFLSALLILRLTPVLAQPATSLTQSIQFIKLANPQRVLSALERFGRIGQ